MDTLAAFLLETFLVHVIDFVVGGAIGYLAFDRKRWWFAAGIALVYGTAVAGTFMGPNDPDSWTGLMVALFGLLAGLIAGFLHRRGKPADSKAPWRAPPE